MNKGERIYSNLTGATYTVSQVLKSGGQAEMAYATSNRDDKRIFHIKRMLGIKYPGSKVGMSPETRRVLLEKCRNYEESSWKIYQEIRRRTLPGGACSYVYDYFRADTFYYVVTEKIDNAVEFDVKALSTAMSIEDKLLLFRTIVYSLHPFEQANVIHADIKPQNIVLKYTDGHYVPKLIDFESSFFADNPPEKGYVVGTEPYYSPELARYNDENNTTDVPPLSTKSDIFSLGIILYEFLTGEYPVPKAVKKYAFELIRDEGSVRLPSNWSSDLRTLVRQMLSLNPKNRPSVMGLLNGLKKLTDKSTSTDEVTSPAVLIGRESEGTAYVHILSKHKNGIISYNIDRTGWKTYLKPFILKTNDVLLVIKINGKPVYNNHISVNERGKGKEAETIPCTKKVAHPIINTSDEGEKIKVTIKCATPGAIIHYTVNEIPPNEKSPIYKSGFYVAKNVTIKAIAVCEGFLPSEIASRNSSSKIKFS